VIVLQEKFVLHLLIVLIVLNKTHALEDKNVVVVLVSVSNVVMTQNVVFQD
jgi:hypothetical protein